MGSMGTILKGELRELNPKPYYSIIPYYSIGPYRTR